VRGPLAACIPTVGVLRLTAPERRLRLAIVPGRQRARVGELIDLSSRAEARAPANQDAGERSEPVGAGDFRGDLCAIAGRTRTRV
jgi:hypothetical protein